MTAAPLHSLTTCPRCNRGAWLWLRDGLGCARSDCGHTAKSSMRVCLDREGYIAAAVHRAVHEAGHAIVAMMLCPDAVEAVTIRPNMREHRRIGRSPRRKRLAVA